MYESLLSKRKPQGRNKERSIMFQKRHDNEENGTASLTTETLIFGIQGLFTICLRSQYLISLQNQAIN